MGGDRIVRPQVRGRGVFYPPPARARLLRSLRRDLVCLSRSRVETTNRQKISFFGMAAFALSFLFIMHILSSMSSWPHAFLFAVWLPPSLLVIVNRTLTSIFLSTVTDSDWVRRSRWRSGDLDFDKCNDWAGGASRGPMTNAHVPSAAAADADRAALVSGWIDPGSRCRSFAYGSLCIQPRERACRRRGDGRDRGAGAAVKVMRSQVAGLASIRVRDPALVRPGRTRQPRGWLRGPVVDTHRCAERDDRADGTGAGGTGWLVLVCPSAHGHARLRRGVRESCRGPGVSAAGGPSTGTVLVMRRARLLRVQRPRVVHFECARRQRGATEEPWRFRCAGAEGQGPKRVRRCYGVDVPAGEGAGGRVRVGPPALRPSSRSARRSAQWRRGRTCGRTRVEQGMAKGRRAPAAGVVRHRGGDGDAYEKAAG
jgi:hypothetical protein